MAPRQLAELAQLIEPSHSKVHRSFISIANASLFLFGTLPVISANDCTICDGIDRDPLAARKRLSKHATMGAFRYVSQASSPLRGAVVAAVYDGGEHQRRLGNNGHSYQREENVVT
ncbi:hypothetical protein Aduo_012307 [Ancylostoma duodenale]